TQRRLRSDYLLVRLDGGGGWMPFRDVFEVDGVAVRDRQDRLSTLFLTPSSTSFEHASAVLRESTRYNLRHVEPTTHLPPLALLFLTDDVRGRFPFARESEETVAGKPAWVVSYKEHARPTLIRSGRERDLPLAGRLWIEPASGLVLKTELSASDVSIRSTITV